VLPEVGSSLCRIPFDDHAPSIAKVAFRLQVCPTPGISCEAVPASDRDGAGMRRHVHSGNHAAESFVSFIPLFGRESRPAQQLLCS
jgi:hypothetical protein